MKPLTVYKASAGSGKTFTLTIEFIKLLIIDPLCFKKILAVTFTNKATEEMKNRILSQLYGIWKELPDSENYMAEITNALGISKKQASKQAGIALNLLIHNYNYFQVETIDSFFQSVLRNLARELDLTANLRIDLNDKQIESEAVDQMIESLDTDSVMLKWLIDYIFSNIEENKSWNVIGQIKSFGETIFQDQYKTDSKQLNPIVSEQDFFDNYINKLRQIRDNAKAVMVKYADDFERIVAEAGLTPQSFNGKSKGICSYFKKLKSEDLSDQKCVNKVLNNCLESPENWVAKSDSANRETILRVVNESLMQLLVNAESDRKKQWRLYKSAKITLKHISKVRLLNSIEEKVRKLNDDANRFLLSDTQFLLHSLINGSDSPFIFEKTGCQLDHIMIDEFQDTSSVQWMNFKILLKECMSHNHEKDANTVNNLIVGDVKQSIYRWRSGDWRLLNNIDKQFENPGAEIETLNLKNNFRSERNVVEFNNCFFSIAIKNEYQNELSVNDEGTSNEIKTAYSDVRQAVPDEKGNKGLVKITLFSGKEQDEMILDEIGQTIERLLVAGIPENKIAILIRAKKHLSPLIDYFMKNKPELKIVSDEAFKLGSSLAVNIIIQALRFLLHPDDVLTKASLAVTYQRKILQKDICDNEIFTDTSDNDLSYLDNLLPERFATRTNEILRKTLLDIVEEIYSLFNLEILNDQSAYICTFYDYVSDFTKDNAGSIYTFLNEWDETICDKNVQCDEINGIRLITIHKSKGLEFDNVIIPFCDWALENTNKNILWCHPKVSPFNELQLVPIDYNGGLLETIYAEDYKNEHIQNTVDNLNLLYVAFTRASKNLFVIGKNGNKNSRSALIDSCLDEMKDLLEGSELTRDEDRTTFEYGELCSNNKTKSKISENVFLLPEELKNVNITSFDSPIQFKQSNKSNDFINNDDAKSERTSYIKMGNVLHKLFSQIHTLADIDNVLKQFEFEGILYYDNITAETIKDTITKHFSDKQVQWWFDPHWKVFNECNILFFDQTNGKVVEKRPDRVIMDDNEMIVIDFKFGSPRDKYQSQVRQYMQLLESMGHTNISGYLWYVYSNKIEKVELK